MRSRGKKLILAVIAVNLVMSAAAIVYGVFASGAENLVPMTVHMILAVVIFCFLYKGYSWARWTAVVLFVIGGFSGIAGSVLMLFMLVDPVFCSIGIASGTVQLISAGVLVFSTPIREYFRRDQ